MINVNGPIALCRFIDKILKNFEIVKFITTVLKSILNLVKLQSFVVKCCKM